MLKYCVCRIVLAEDFPFDCHAAGGDYVAEAEGLVSSVHDILGNFTHTKTDTKG